MSAMQGFPEPVAQALKRLIEELESAAPEPRALIAYGSVVRGGYRPERSDVNLMVVLGQASPEVLRALQDPLRRAFRAVRLAPYLVLESELPRLADVFPIKLADIQRHHRVILGRVGLTEVRVNPADMRLRVEQELRNHLLRLRRHYVFAADDPAVLARALVPSVTSLAVALEALVRLSRGEPHGTSISETFAEAASRFDLDGATLARLAAFRDGAEEADVPGLYTALLACVARAVEVADQLEPST